MNGLTPTLKKVRNRKIKACASIILRRWCIALTFLGYSLPCKYQYVRVLFGDETMSSSSSFFFFLKQTHTQGRETCIVTLYYKSIIINNNSMTWVDFSKSKKKREVSIPDQFDFFPFKNQLHHLKKNFF